VEYAFGADSWNPDTGMSYFKPAWLYESEPGGREGRSGEGCE